MRLENGMRFDRCIGLQDRDGMDGRVFDADVLTCHHRPLSVERTSAWEGGRIGTTATTASELHLHAAGAVPRFRERRETLQRSLHRAGTLSKRNGHYYVLPYVQSGETSGAYTRRAFGFAGEYENRKAAEQAGLEAGKQKSTNIAR